ncbi:UNVERIFIED_CONTAM: hypothetical protein Slati_2756700, partial [Sesamum latifolium]
ECYQQRAKLQWLKGGDQRTRIFFRKVAMRRASKRVFQITDGEGRVRTKQHEIIDEFVGYFQRLLGDERWNMYMDIRYLHPWAWHIIIEEEANQLVAPVTKEEVKYALFDIEEDKLLGPDGYTAGFYKAAWPIIGDEVTRAVMDFFLTGHLLKQVNATLLVLIPKVQASATVADFKPISCCNVLCKAIMKIIFQRLRPILDHMINPSQNAFILGRSIGDNILLAQELFTGYNQQRLPPRCPMKVDLRKAYDMVE